MVANFWTNLNVLARTFCLGLPIGITIIDVFGYVAKVEGHSMQPHLNPEDKNPTRNKIFSDYVFLYNWPIARSLYDDIKRGEVVALISPRDPKHRLIKRVVGLGGDVIETKGYYKPIVEVPPGHCWVEGDNRNHSFDSNSFGCVPLGLVKSKAVCIVWPPARIGMLHQNLDVDRIPINLSKSLSSSEKSYVQKAKPNLLHVDSSSIREVKTDNNKLK